MSTEQQSYLNKKEFFDTHGDMLHSGRISSLLSYGFNSETALIEGLDNSFDAECDNIKVVIDKENKMLYLIDNGNGANMARLKRLSTLDDVVSAVTTKQGTFNAGAKYMLAYLTQLFKDSQLKDKKDKNIMEEIKTTISVISKCNDYNKFKETPIGQICIDFITPLKGGLYKNEPKPAEPLNIKLWEALAIDASLPGTIICIPLDDSVYDEIITNIDTDTIDKSLRISIGIMYNKYFKINQSCKIQFMFVNSINVTHDDSVGISINIDTNDCKAFDIIPFDPLHYDSILSDNKAEYTFTVYKHNNSNKIKILYYHPNNGIMAVKKKNKNDYVQTKEADDVDVINYTEVGKFTQKLTHSEDWEEDYVYLTAILGNDDQSPDDKNLLNTRNIERNNKIIHKELTPKLTSGDNYKKKTMKNSRETISYSSNLDAYFGLNVKKSQLNIDLLAPEIIMITEWARSKFIEKINKEKLKIINARKIQEEEELKQKQKPQPKPEPKPQPKPEPKPEPKPKPQVVIVKKKKNVYIESDLEDTDDSTESFTVNNLSPQSQVVLDSDDDEEESVSSYESVVSITDNNIQTPSLQSTQLVSEAVPANIGFTLSETVNDSGTSSDSDNSESTQLAKAKVEVFPTLTNRKPNKAEYVNKKDFILELKNWEQKVNFHHELNSQLYTLFKVYSIIHEYSFEVTFNKLTIKDKIEIIINHINKKYPFEKDLIDGGINFHRAYNEYVQ